MIDARVPAASYGATVEGSAQILTCESSQKYNSEIHRKYLSEAADPRVGPVFAAWDDVTIRVAAVSVMAWDMREADIGKSLVAHSRAILDRPLER